MVRGLAKWRRKTVDFADDIFMDVAVAFGAPDTRPKAEKKKKEEEKATPSIVAAAGPIVIGGADKKTDIKVTTARNLPIQFLLPLLLPLLRLVKLHQICRVT